MSWPWLHQWSMGGRRYRLHWSLALGVLAAFLFSMSVDTVIGYLLVIAAHHAGHLLMARRGKLAITTIGLHGLGGNGVLRGEASQLSHALAGAGGIFGQLVLWWTAMLVASVFGADTSGALYQALTTLNLGIAALNLLPLANTDGEALWSLPRALVTRLEEKLTMMQLEEIEEKRASWQEMIDRDAAQVPVLPTDAPDFARLLAEQDAREDEGIPDALASEVSALLAGVWSEE